MEREGWCVEKNINPHKEWLYRETFTTEYNYAFHKPGKDQCDQCDAYQKATVEEKALKEDQYQKHMRRKEQAARHKAQDKEKS